MLRYVPTRRGEWYVRRSGCDAHRLVERDLVALRVRDAIESRGTMTATGSNRGDTENRTSGGVGGCRGAIPVIRPDRRGPDLPAATDKRRWVAEEGTTRSSVGEKPSSELERGDRAAFSDRNRSERSIDRERRTKTLHPSRGLEYPDRAGMAKTEIPG